MVFAIAQHQWPFVTPQMFGGREEATAAANDAAFAAMIATGLPMLVPPTNPGEYYVFEETIAIPDRSSFLGAGFYQEVRFKKRDKSTAAFQVGGRFEFGNLWAEFEDTVTDADTAANLVAIKGANLSVFKPLRLYNAYNGFFLMQEEAVGEDGTSTFYQNQVETLYVTDCARRHIDLSTFGDSASTGNFFGNIRTDNQGQGAIPISVQFAKFTGSVVQNMNLEAGQYSGAVLALGGHGFNIGSLHMEAIELTEWGAALIGAAGLTLNIGTWKVQGTIIGAGNLGTLVKLEPTGGEVEIASLVEGDAVLGEGAEWKAVYYWDTSPTSEPVGLTVRQVNAANVANTAEASGSGQTGLVKQWGTA